MKAPTSQVAGFEGVQGASHRLSKPAPQAIVGDSVLGCLTRTGHTMPVELACLHFWAAFGAEEQSFVQKPEEASPYKSLCI